MIEMHSLAGAALSFIATAVAAVGIHMFDNGAVLIGAIMIGVLFALYGEEGNDEKTDNFRRLGFWAVVIIGDILAIVRLIQNWI